jgi:hypothetical protein
MLSIAVKHLILDKDQYILDLSENDAEALGISASCYDKMINDIAKTNDFIKKNSNTIASLQDPQEVKLNQIRLKSGNEDYVDKDGMKYRGKMVPSEFGRTYPVTIPDGISKVKFIFLGVAWSNLATIHIKKYANDNYPVKVSFATILSATNTKTVSVQSALRDWTITAILNYGSGTIAIWY